MGFDDFGGGVAVVLATLNSGHAVARTLGRLGVSVTAVYPKSQGVTRSRYWHRIFVLDMGDRAGLATARRLSEIGRRTGGIAPLIATTDDQVRFIAAHADSLSAYFRISVASLELIRTLSDKQLLFQLCRDKGVPAPATYFPATVKEAEQVSTEARLPLILKSRQSWSSNRQLRVVAKSAKEVSRLYSLVDPALYMLQEYVPKADDSRWMFNGYFDATHRCLFGLTAIKVREHPVDGGIASLAEARWNPRLASEAVDFLEQVGYVGPVDIDYCYDPRTDEYMVLDVNPRLGAAFRAFVDSKGWDVARVMFADLTGTAVRVGVPVDGRRWLAEHADVAAALRYRRRRLLSLRGYLESVKKVRELAWFSFDDPRPVLDLARRAMAKLRPVVGRERHG